MDPFYLVKGVLIKVSCEMKDCDIKSEFTMPLPQFAQLPNKGEVKEYLADNGWFIQRNNIICRACALEKLESRNMTK